MGEKLSKEEIIEALRRHRGALSRYKVRRIGLFGSFAKGEQGAGSDIDFVVEFEEPSLANFMGLSRFLERLFGKKVDIITPAGIESIRVGHVKEEIKRSITYV